MASSFKMYYTTISCQLKVHLFLLFSFVLVFPTIYVVIPKRHVFDLLSVYNTKFYNSYLFIF